MGKVLPVPVKYPVILRIFKQFKISIRDTLVLDQVQIDDLEHCKDEFEQPIQSQLQGDEGSHPLGPPPQQGAEGVAGAQDHVDVDGAGQAAKAACWVVEHDIWQLLNR